MLRGVERLDTGTRADVQCGAHRSADGDPGECGGGPSDAEDDALLVRTDPARAAHRAAQVGDDEPVLVLRPAVRPHVDRRPHLAVRLGQPAVRHAFLQRQHGGRTPGGDRALEQEEAHECVERRVPPGGTQRRNRLAAGERGVGGCAEQVKEPVGGEGGGEQGCAKPGRVVCCGKAGLTHMPHCDGSH